MTETMGTSTPTPAPDTTHPGTPVVVSTEVTVGGQRAVSFMASAMAGPGVDPYDVANGLAGVLRTQVSNYAYDMTYGKAPSVEPRWAVDLAVADLLDVDESADGDRS